MSSPSISVGDVLGHYRILVRIGAGGMGVVYRAQDLRLDRDVALKVLPPGTLSTQAASNSLRKEALILSKLNHPNIATIHDFDTQAGVDFFVMEYVPGITLEARLAHGALPEKKVLALGTQIACALEHAHENGVAHRDFKPGNILITPKEQAKVLDFGLAKLFRPALPGDETEPLTERQQGGTLLYMSPEQLCGQEPDFRSDIYSVGVVLYEMATGRRPFDNKPREALIGDIVYQQPVPPCRVTQGISAKLEDIILKCLDKDPDNRYQSAKELEIDLRRLATISTTASHVFSPPRRARRKILMGVIVLAVLSLPLFYVVGKWLKIFPFFSPQGVDSLAVLPLANLSGDPTQEYFVEGMHEELISDLAKIKALRVISRTSVMQYKNNAKSLRAVAQELGVTAVIEGAVQREGNQVRISVQLIRAPSDKLIWAQNYQREMHDVLTLQSEVARQIAREIRVAVTPAEEADLARAGPVNVEVHELYLRGRYYSNRYTFEDVNKAIGYFNQAIAKDPRYAPAYAGLGEAYYILSSQFLAPHDAIPKVEEAASKALQIDDTLAEAHTSLGLVKAFYRYDFGVAEKEFRRATELNPNSSPAHEWYGYFLMGLGRQTAAQAELKIAQDLDPFSSAIKSTLGMSYLFARDYDQAIDQLRRASDLDSDFWWPRYFLGVAYNQKGMTADARSELSKAIASAASPWPTAYLGYMDGVAGKRKQAEGVLLQLEQQAKKQYVSPYSIAIVYLGLGESARALDWLEKAYDARDDALLFLSLDPTCENLRREPRFQQLVRRIGLPESHGTQVSSLRRGNFNLH